VGRENLIEETAARLLGAYQGDLLAPISPDFAVGDVDAAYAVQRVQVRQWRAAGRRLAGRKIGLTSQAVQRQLGVGEPDFGHLFADMIFEPGQVVPFERLQQPKVEAEIALILGADLDGPEVDAASVLAAIASVIPAIEIVSSRIADWKINIVDTVADNASSGLVMLGGPARRPEGLDLVGCEMTMSVNGQVVSRGRGADCLGHPLNAAVWLARRSAQLGQPLRAGEIILTGALGPMAVVAPGDRVEAEITGIGSVSLAFGQGASNLGA
jgi:2-keto-4-pentenoate hydratase